MMGPAIRPPKTLPTSAADRACGSADSGDAGSPAIAVDAADDGMVLSLLSSLSLSTLSLSTLSCISTPLGPYLHIQLYAEKIIAGHSRTFSPSTSAAPSLPSICLARACARFQAGAMLSRSLRPFGVILI